MLDMHCCCRLPRWGVQRAIILFRSESRIIPCVFWPTLSGRHWWWLVVIWQRRTRQRGGIRHGLKMGKVNHLQVIIIQRYTAAPEPCWTLIVRVPYKSYEQNQIQYDLSIDFTFVLTIGAECVCCFCTKAGLRKHPFSTGADLKWEKDKLSSVLHVIFNINIIFY